MGDGGGPVIPHIRLPQIHTAVRQRRKQKIMKRVQYILLIFLLNLILKNGGASIAIRYAKFHMEGYKGKKH